MILQGQPATLHVLDLGTFAVHAGRLIGIPGYLITTDRGERLLVDTGFHQGYADDPAGVAQAEGLAAFGVLQGFGAQNLITAQLALIGVRPAEIGHLLLTHSHIDHIGGLAHFPAAQVIIGAAERALPRPLYWGAYRPMDWPDMQWLPVHEDTDLGPHLTVLHVPGHAPGQLALRFDLPQTGRVILMSDAISRPSEPAEGFDSAHDPALAAMHAARLLAMPCNLRIWGHCPAQWPQLRKAPASYG
ncbi:MAG: MBL fold metallo-hydrolase [Rhodobacteraceae bacterium]|jgi:N-acyl homoserine lactone hydrolase|nr:MBL fold metallo-hydrolase [Paracoccaceae bacterium]